MKVILASNSPRRKELLANIGMDFDVVPSDVQEIIRNDECPEVSVMSLAFQKAYDVFSRINSDESIIIAADTIVVVDGVVLTKPKDESDARKMLKLLSGKTHTVYTGYAIVRQGRKIVNYESTKVKIGELDDNIIDAYIRTNESGDKAAAYAIQGYGALIVESICGDYFNVVGLPLYKLSRDLSLHFGVNMMA